MVKLEDTAPVIVHQPEGRPGTEVTVPVPFIAGANPTSKFLISIEVALTPNVYVIGSIGSF